MKIALLSSDSNLKPQSPAIDALRRFGHHRSGQFGAALLGLMLFMAIFAPLIAPFSPTKPLDNVKRRSAPCIHLLGCPADQPEHIMGIDSNNRDLFSRIIFGSQLSLQIGVVTISFAILLGGLIGTISGFFGGWIDNIMMRSMDILMAFPGLLLAIAIVSVLGPGLINALLAIAIVSIPVYARVVRSSVLSVINLEFVDASRALGASRARLIFTRILP